LAAGASKRTGAWTVWILRLASRASAPPSGIVADRFRLGDRAASAATRTSRRAASGRPRPRSLRRKNVPRGREAFHEAVAVGKSEVPLLGRNAGAFGIHDPLVQANAAASQDFAISMARSTGSSQG